MRTQRNIPKQPCNVWHFRGYGDTFFFRRRRAADKINVQHPGSLKSAYRKFTGQAHTKDTHCIGGLLFCKTPWPRLLSEHGIH